MNTIRGKSVHFRKRISTSGEEKWSFRYYTIKDDDPSKRLLKEFFGFSSKAAARQGAIDHFIELQAKDKIET